MEPISKISEVNGEPVPKDRQLTKADFASDDMVVVRFKNKDFRGRVDFSRDEETLAKRVDSPSISKPQTQPVCTSTPVTTTQARVRKRHQSHETVGTQRSVETKLGKRSRTVGKLSDSDIERGRKKQRTSGTYMYVHIRTCVLYMVCVRAEARAVCLCMCVRTIRMLHSKSSYSTCFYVLLYCLFIHPYVHSLCRFHNSRFVPCNCSLPVWQWTIHCNYTHSIRCSSS